MLTKEEIEVILPTFRSEAREFIQQIGDSILAVEKESAAAARNAAAVTSCRAAHSLKGSAAMLGFANVEKLVHALEELLVPLRDGKVTSSAVIVDLVLKTLDRVDAMIADWQPGLDELGPDDAAWAANLRAVGKGGAAAGPAAAPAAKSAPEGKAESLAPVDRAAAAVSHDESRELKTAEGDSIIRISQRKLDNLLNYIGEIVEMKIRMEEMAECVRGVDEQLAAIERPEVRLPRRPLQQLAVSITQDIQYLGKLLGGIQDELREARMVPVGSLFPTLRRAVHDVCRKVGYEVEFSVEGGEVELGRSIIDEIKSPLVHILRNAISHGIEPSEERLALGKAAIGRVKLRAQNRGNSVVVEVIDDGRGIDYGRVFKKAQEMRLFAADAVMPPEAELSRLLFVSGLSTAESATMVSGRGVGLDAVKQAVERLRGTISIKTEHGKGASFAIGLPLTLATNAGLIAQVGAARYVMPRVSVDRAMEVFPKDVSNNGGRTYLWYEGRLIPFAALDQALNLRNATCPEQGCTALIIRSTELLAAIAVDRIVGEAEIMVRELGSILQRVDKLSGVTVTASGDMLFVLNPADLLRDVFAASGVAGGVAGSGAAGGNGTPGGEASVSKHTILVVDDSVTARTLSQKILSACGYRVLTAFDGAQAYELLLTQPCNLVLTDIEMPELDGYGLTRKIKANPKLAGVPVVLLTSMGTDDARRRGIECGADAYLVKKELSQASLIETISQLV
jgi:two-component system, chemotaxis family, sensor kinase CheA